MNTTAMVSNINHVIDLALQTATTIGAFVSNHKNPPRELNFIVTELGLIADALKELRSFLVRSAIFNVHTKELIEETIKSVASCENRLRELGGIIIDVCGFGIFGRSDCLWVQRLSVGLPGRKMGMLWRLAWHLTLSRAVKAILKGLQAQHSKLIMMVDIFNRSAPTRDGIQRSLGPRNDSTTSTDSYSPLTDPNSEDYEIEEVLWLSSVYQRLCPELNQRHLAINSKDSIGTWSIYAESEMSHIAVLRVPLRRP